MTEPWDIDPTEPDRDGAGAEGGAMGGDSAGDSTLPPPLQPPEKIDRTNHFQPTGTSTPYRPPDYGGEGIEMSYMPLDEIGEFLGPDVPLRTDFVNADEKKKMLDKAKRFIKDKFPKVDEYKLGPLGFSKKPGNEDTIVRFGPQGGEEAVFKKDGSGFLKSFTDKFKTSLGPSAENLLAEENQEIRELNQRKKEAEKQLKEAERIASLKQTASDEVKNLRDRIEQTQARIDAREEEQGSNLEAQSEIDRLKRLKKNL